MPPGVLCLTLGLEKRLPNGVPVAVMRETWGPDEPPRRAGFLTLLGEAYGEIELPFFPHRAWVEATTARGAVRAEACDPEDEARVGAARWDAVVVAVAGSAR